MVAPAHPERPARPPLPMIVDRSSDGKAVRARATAPEASVGEDGAAAATGVGWSNRRRAGAVDGGTEPMARRLVMAALLPLAMTVALQARAGDVEDCYNDTTLRQTEPAKAAAACRRLAEQGDAQAQSVMGVLYAYGEGVPQDVAEAAKWYRKAADQGNAKAQYHLGLMYAKGRSVPRDLVQALMWLDLAAAQGDALAARSGDQVAAKMTPAQIKEAEALIAAWKPTRSQ
jgi:hypothetical protein